jgi:hypothetical protein
MRFFSSTPFFVSAVIQRKKKRLFVLYSKTMFYYIDLVELSLTKEDAIVNLFCILYLGMQAKKKAADLVILSATSRA